MIKNPTELGVRRVGTKRVPMFGGMNLEKDPGIIPPEQFRYLVNVDFRGGGLAPRGGTVPIDAALAGCVQAIADAGNIGRNKLYLVAQGCPGIAATGVSLLTFDTDYGTSLIRNVYYNSAERGFVAFFAGDYYFAADGFFKKLNLRQPSLGGEEPVLTAGTNQDTVDWVWPGGRVLYMAVAFGKLYISVQEDATSTHGAIWVWDGLTMRRIQAVGVFVDPPTWMGFFRNEVLVLGYPSSVNHITTMTEAEVFTNFSPSAGTLSVVDGVEHEDNLYLVGDSTTMWKWTGTGTVTPERIIAGATMRGITSAYGMIWYLYKSSLNHAILGRRAKDAVFADVVKDFTTQDPLNIDVNRVRFYRNELMVNTVKSSTNHPLYRSISAENVPAGWTEVFALPGTSAVPNIQYSVVI